MNRAQEPRLRGGSSVAVALHATAGLASNRFSAGCRLSLMRMASSPRQGGRDATQEWVLLISVGAGFPCPMGEITSPLQPVLNTPK